MREILASGRRIIDHKFQMHLTKFLVTRAGKRASWRRKGAQQRKHRGSRVEVRESDRAMKALNIQRLKFRV